MIHNRAVEIIKNILEIASYEVEDGEGLIDLSAYYDDECIVVLCSDDREKIDQFNKKTIRVRLGEDTADCKKLIFTMNNNPGAENCIIWGYSELLKYSGQASVAYVLDQALSLKLEREKSSSGETGFVSSTPTLDDYGPELPLMPSPVTEEKARHIAGIKGELRRIYIPHYLYSCKSSGEKQYKTHIIDFNAEESGLINAITGSPAPIEIPDSAAPGIHTRSVPVGSKILKPEMDINETENRIIHQIKEKLTKNVRISKTEGDTIFYEDIEVAPGDENLELKIDLVYLPVIQIRGDKIIEVETFTGSIMKEPVDDGVELL